jgi:DNA-binding NarL/FixJ family response regulator
MVDMRDKTKAATGPSNPDTDALDSLSSKSSPYRILVVDDHPVVRRGIRAILEMQPDIEWIEASNGAEAIDVAKTVKPDLALIDLTMPEMNGLEVTAAIREQVPDTEVIVLSMHFSEELAREVLRCGALGYVLKSDADEELLAAVDHARRHQPFFTTRLAMTMAHNFVAGRAGDVVLDENGQPASPLTERETQVVQLLAEGKSNKEVAAALGVSTRTVESHRNHIMHKMNFTSFSDLIKFAVRNNLVEL